MTYFLFGFTLSFLVVYFLSSYVFRSQKSIAPPPNTQALSPEEKTSLKGSPYRRSDEKTFNTPPPTASNWKLARIKFIEKYGEKSWKKVSAVWEYYIFGDLRFRGDKMTFGLLEEAFKRLSECETKVMALNARRAKYCNDHKGNHVVNICCRSKENLIYELNFYFKDVFYERIIIDVTEKKVIDLKNGKEFTKDHEAYPLLKRFINKLSYDKTFLNVKPSPIELSKPGMFRIVEIFLDCRYQELDGCYEGLIERKTP